ncbi:Chromatin assembly factor 1 subunit A family protein [Candida albicans]|uniref:Chromatin assembly factor 1 subunit A family protein n=1 Tax=Candida albicans TaxID=5476 RepID=A0A8H6F3L7_CANAX|nr:Chromatin assembly factor 1 subunit A family protein [Candida albicans]
MASQLEIIDLTNETTDLSELSTTQTEPIRTKRVASQTVEINNEEIYHQQKSAKQTPKLEKAEKEKQKQEEKLRKEQEKLEKKRKKELKKQKQEEERRAKELKKEERLQKEKEKQEKERLRLEKKQKLEEQRLAKEAEKKRLEEEKRKIEEAKERSQMKISSFFQIGQKRKEKKVSSDSSETDATKATPKSFYETEFLPFFVQKNVSLMNIDNQDISGSKSILDDFINGKLQKESSFKSYLSKFTKSSPSTTNDITPEEIINALNSPTTTENQVYQLIQDLPPIKYISFYENSKPPYIGTYCSLAHQKCHDAIIQNPLDNEITGLDYGYDSDLEWNKEDEEGEDIENEDDEDDDDSVMGDEDDEEFVEDDPQSNKKKFITLTVINKWNNEENSQDFQSFATVKLVDIAGSIDPFHNYWATQNEPQVQEVSTTQDSMKPVANILINKTTPTVGTSSSPNILIAQKKTIKDSSVLANLIKFVENNNDFTIGTLVELSKKEFKDFTKALIKNTIQEIAVYDKKSSKWEIKAEMKEKYCS